MPLSGRGSDQVLVGSADPTYVTADPTYVVADPTCVVADPTYVVRRVCGPDLRGYFATAIRGRGLSILHAGAIVVAIQLALPVLAAHAADAPRTTIEGGADETGHNYSWTVTNHHHSPVVSVEFPHHHAGLFFAPEGWSTEVTALVNVGYTEASGVATATADTPAAGIRRGAFATFRMRIAPLPTGRGRGTVRLRFADGNEEQVGGVEVAVAQPVGDKYAPLIGLGTVFVIVIAVRRGRRRRARRSGDPGGSEPSGSS